MLLRTSIAAAVLTALLLWASAPPVGVAWLAWLAIVPAAAVALRHPGSRGGRLAVPLAYALYLELLLVPAFPLGLTRRQWGDPALPVLVADSPAVFIGLVAVPLFGLLLYALRFPQPLRVDRLPAPLAGVAAVWVPAVVWTGLDLVRVKFDPSGLWGPLFLSQHDSTTARLAALGGPWLVTLAIVAANYTLALLASRGRAGLPAALLAGGLALGLVASAPLWSESSEGGRRSVAVAAVQPGFDTTEYERPALRHFRPRIRNPERTSLDLIADLSPLVREASRRGAALAVWPEATVWVHPRKNGAVREGLARLARETDLVLVVPFFVRSRSHGGTVVVLPSGALTRTQPKQRPMWFLGEREGGGQAGPVTTGIGRVGALLGVDNQDAAAARRLVQDGAAVLTSSTHDWAQLAVAQKAFTRLHAVALGVPIVRADWRYGSAIIDSDGRKQADAGGEKRRALLVASVQPRRGWTLYSRVGDAFGWTLAAAGLAAVVASAAARLLGAASAKLLQRELLRRGPRRA